MVYKGNVGKHRSEGAVRLFCPARKEALMANREKLKSFLRTTATGREERRITLRLVHSAVLGMVLALLCSQLGIAQEAGSAAEVAQLKAKLTAQEALIQKLLRRLETLETSQARILERMDEVPKTIPSAEALRQERDELLAEVRGDVEEIEERLDLRPILGGYYDFEYIDDDRSDNPGAFRQHHVTLLLSKEYEAFRVFSEIEFEFGTLFGGEGGMNLETARGEVKVEQGWGEYLFSDQLTLRGGLLLTPGYWNVNHWPNLVLSTRRPLMVRQIYPESFAGVMGYGTKYWEDFGVTYYAYVANGVSDNFAQEDDNDDKAVGGRVSFHVPTKKFFHLFDLGVSGYTDGSPGVQRTRTWGLDTQVRKGPYELLAEFATRNAEEDRTGFYLQPGYRFGKQWAGFYRFDRFDIENGDEAREHTLGIRFRPIPEVSLKLEYFRSNRLLLENHNGVAASIAIAH